MFKKYYFASFITKNKSEHSNNVLRAKNPIEAWRIATEMAYDKGQQEGKAWVVKKIIRVY